MVQNTIDQKEFLINVGPLNGLASLTYFLANQFNQVNYKYRSGINPEVIWDLRNVMPRYQSMASLTAFLSLAHRLRLFTGHASQAYLRWNPEVLSFWSDIGLLDLSQKYNLIEWPEELMGGYPKDLTNPNTKIIAYPLDVNIPNQSDSEQWKKWKDDKREEVKKQLLDKCGNIFKNTQKWKFPSRLQDQIAITSAELIVNAQIHGKSMAFLGMQRTSKRITVAVCDAGIGFINSLQMQTRKWSQLRRLTNVEAIFIGSVENMREMGLRRAIDNTVRIGGYVLISSNNAEVRWDDLLWEKAKNVIKPEQYVIPNIIEVLGKPIKGKADLDQKLKGYYRIWQYGLRGTRVSFEIEFDDTRKDYDR